MSLIRIQCFMTFGANQTVDINISKYKKHKNIKPFLFHCFPQLQIDFFGEKTFQSEILNSVTLIVSQTRIWMQWERLQCCQAELWGPLGGINHNWLGHFNWLGNHWIGAPSKWMGHQSNPRWSILKSLVWQVELYNEH